MKTRKAFATLTICVLLALTIATFVNMHLASAQSIANCHKLVSGTYLLTDSGDSVGSSFRSIATFTQDGNLFGTASVQSGVPPLLDQSLDQNDAPSLQPFGNAQGSWKCTSDTEITVTALAFLYPTATLPVGIARTDLRATFDPKAGIVQGAAKLRRFDLNANPLNDDAPVARTYNFTGQRITPGQ